MNAEVILKTLVLLADVASRATAAYGQMREVAQQAGVTDAQLAEADARLSKVYIDPLADES